MFAFVDKAGNDLVWEAQLLESKTGTLSLLQILDQRCPIETEGMPWVRVKYVILYFLVATLEKGKPGDINVSFVLLNQK